MVTVEDDWSPVTTITVGACIKCAPHACTCQLVARPYTFTPYEPRLSDADVDRIARRLAELLRSEGTP